MGNIVIRNLCKSFGSRKVIENFSAEIHEGKVTAFTGKSGCGKTTLLKIIMGLEKSDKGEISGTDGLKFSCVFQEDRLFEELNAVTNVCLATEDETVTDKMREAFMLAGLDVNNPEPVKKYSGGMKRRVAILRALFADFDVLILDEPFLGLDKETYEDVAGLILKYAEGKTVIMVSHNKSELQYFHAREIKL